MAKIQALFNNLTFKILLLIFIAAVGLRFLYFPDNIYFGYDQARDAFISKELLQGHLKIIGPTTSLPGLNHGALFYYIFAPVYFVSQFDPTGLSVFLRIYNALGVFLIFFIGKNLFNKWVGIISALLFAFSYEQTQYALFMTHPTLAVISVLTFYLGLSILLFKQKSYGLPVALLGFGLSFQFHFLLAYLGLILLLILGIFWRRIPKLNVRIVLYSLLALSLSLSTFAVAEVRFGFSGIKNLISSSSNFASGSAPAPMGGIEGVKFAAQRYVEDNIFYSNNLSLVILLILLSISIYFLRFKKDRDQIAFLLIWFIVGLFSYFINETSLYFYGIGTSISLLILTAMFVNKIFIKFKAAAVVLVIIILVSNLGMIIKNNGTGPNKEINVQLGMLLSDEKKVIDYMYSQAGGEPFAVNAFSMPLYINTTWSYLFEWYGQKKYGYLPVWGGKAAEGYHGNIVINNSRTTLPDKRFLVAEPVRGIEHLEKDFMIEEGYFTDILETRQFGKIRVNSQKPK